jgi:cytoskeletal protein CcmA (bactofilin family)
MSTSSGIGQSIQIKGDIHAEEPFLVAGRIDGSIVVQGHPLTVAEGANVDAKITAESAIIQGSLKGTLTAATKIVVQPTATIDGELSAPAIGVAEGATIHAKIATTRAKPKLAAVS